MTALQGLFLLLPLPSGKIPCWAGYQESWENKLISSLDPGGTLSLSEVQSSRKF